MLNRVLYYIILKPLSYLPFSILYPFSDFLYLVLYKGFKYRKDVVRTNLLNSFPEKSSEEIQKIERAFYRHFCDLIIESVRLFSISAEELRKRNVMKNPEVMNRLYDEGKSLIAVGGHFNNWETGAAIVATQVKHHIAGIYAPLTNQFFNDKILKSRGKFGLELLSRKTVKAGFERNKNNPTTTIFATDQSPTHSKSILWTMFLNQPTAVNLGAELFAKEYDCPLVFIYVTKVKRGYYEIETILMEKDPTKTRDGEITEKHVRWLEKQIRDTPQYWLWTHKRWKRIMKEGEEFYKATN